MMKEVIVNFNDVIEQLEPVFGTNDVKIVFGDGKVTIYLETDETTNQKKSDAEIMAMFERYSKKTNYR